jgi:predicted amidohydrolase YtcJ
MSEILFTGGTILTMSHGTPRAEALLVRDRRIAAVGDEGAVRNAMATRDATHVDLGGRTIVPGFNDSHVHALQLGARESALQLGGIAKTGILERVRERADSTAGGELLIGYDWDYPDCPDPHRKDLDAVVADRPVVLFQFSGHGAWLNTRALRYLHIDRDTPDWGVGGADRDEGGELTGIVRELLQAPRVRRMFVKQMRDRVQVREHLTRALELLARYGITSVQDNTWFPWIVDEIARLHRDGALTTRFSCWSPGFLWPLDFLFDRKHFDSFWYRKGPLKYFIDGAFSSYTAWLGDPYADRPETSGRGIDAVKIARHLERANRRRRQIAFHAIGDAAVAAYLDAIERFDVSRVTPLRHRIEHAQIVRDEDIERIARYGMVVAAQPNAASTPEKDLVLLGAERARRAYPYRSLIDAGVHLAFGSDYPGEATFDPLYGVHVAVNRATEQAITPEEALSAYTAEGAWAEFAEERKGRLESGYLADLVILSADPTVVDPLTIRDIQVDATMVDGEFVYRRPGVESIGGSTIAK